MKIKRMSVSVSEAGIIKRINELYCKEAANTYIVSAQSNFGGKTTRVKKEEILKIDSMVRENLYHQIEAYTWYFEVDEYEAYNLLYDKISVIAIKQAEVSCKMVEHLKVSKSSS